MMRPLFLSFSLVIIGAALATPAPQEPAKPEFVKKAAAPAMPFQQALKADQGAKPRLAGPTDPTEPAMVTLDFKDRPIQEIVNTISTRSGNPLTLQFWNDPEGN